MPSTPNLILQYFCLGIIAKLGIDSQSCFPSITPALDLGWEGDVQIQVCPGSAAPDGGGKGNQDGGALIIRQNFNLIVFYRLNIDPHGRSDQILTQNATGLTDFVEKMKDIFLNTYLNNMSIERIRYEGETQPVWTDAERGIVQKQVTYSANYGRDLPGITLTNQDIVSQIITAKSP